MILSYKVGNFKSISDPIELDFVANAYEDQTQYEPYFVVGKKKVLKGIGLFGSNASGKSNVLESLNAFAYTIIQSANFSEHQSNEMIVPFAFSEKMSLEPTVFDLCFLLDDVKYSYHLALTKNEIVSETLSYSPNGRKVPLLERNGKSLFLNKTLFTEEIKSVVSERNLSNKPVVTFAAQFNIPLLKNVYAFVRSRFLFTNGLGDAYEQGIGALIDKNEDYQRFLVSLMKASDLSIDDVTIRKEAMNMPFFASGAGGQNLFVKQDLFKVYTTHRIGEKSCEFGLNAESLGTRKVMASSGALFNALKGGALLVFDEFGSSLHPELAKFLLSLFFDPDINTKKTQILFASHNSRLLNAMILRRDEMYMCEKDRKENSTKVYPLSDFSVRKTENIENGFLNGRYVEPPNLDEGEIKL